MEPIDFVITWVDGNDPDWQAEKRKYQPEGNTDDRPVRYLDWDNLQYWFRAVEKYAPWVNKIHFVTWGHLPKWLNVNHPKLNIVKHSDYIPAEYLPTFSSHPIELNLHRIEGLSENFVYFNDDMFLNAPVKPEDFFKNGKPVDRLVFDVMFPREDQIASIIYNNTCVISKYINKKNLVKKNLWKILYPFYGIAGIKNYLTLPLPWFTGFYNHHLPNNFTKSVFNELWEKENEILHGTCNRKFRSKDDVSPWLMRYWYLAQGHIMPCSYRQGMIFEIKDDNLKLYKAIEKEKYKLICCNDAGRYNDFEKQKEQLRQAFHIHLSKKSTFEYEGKF